MGKEYEEIATSTWQGTVPFFNHLKDQWTAQAEARRQLVGADNIEDKSIYLELIFDSLQITIDILSFYLNEEELNKCDKIINNINAITGEKEIIAASLDSSQLSDIRNKLKILSRLIWRYQGKYELLPKVEKSRLNVDTFDLAEEENV